MVHFELILDWQAIIWEIYSIQLGEVLAIQNILFQSSVKKVIMLHGTLRQIASEINELSLKFFLTLLVAQTFELQLILVPKFSEINNCLQKKKWIEVLLNALPSKNLRGTKEELNCRHKLDYTLKNEESRPFFITNWSKIAENEKTCYFQVYFRSIRVMNKIKVANKVSSFIGIYSNVLFIFDKH